MARTPKTAHTKAQMAEEARQEEEARLQREVRLAEVTAARTRSEKAQALARVREAREAEDTGQGGGGEDNAGTEETAGQEEAGDKEAGEGGGVEGGDDVEEEKADDEENDAWEDDAEEDEGGDAQEHEEGDELEGGKDEEGEDAEDADEENLDKNVSRAAKPKRTPGKKRSASQVDDDDLVRVPSFKAVHDSWTDLELSLKEYMDATRQKIVIKEVISVARRNANLRAQVRYQGRPESEIPLVPGELEPYQRKYICTHGWEERERSTGKRTSHTLRRTECPFQKLGQLTHDRDGTWCIKMKREVYSHNHYVSEEIYRSYPGIRQVPEDSPLMPGIELLLDAQAGTTSIYDYIRSNSNHHVTMDDVRNLIRRTKSKGVELPDNDAVAEMIVDFNRESPKNVSTVHESTRGDTGVILFSSGHMRAMQDSFPEVLQMDCTHKTNRYNYQLLSIVAMDQFGQGQPVQYSLVESNSDWHMAKALDHFKRENEYWRFVRIVVVDKDMREVEIIRKKLPEARVLLCHFHVIKWLHNTIRNSKKYGPYDDSVLAQMKHTITNMVYSRTVAEYEMHREEFKSLACQDDRTELWDYFVKNWDDCSDMWVMAHRVDLPHFGNHTNNRVESFFGKLKRRLKGHFTMRASLEVLLKFQRQKEESYRSKVQMPGTLRDVAYSDEMNIVLGMTTRWVAAAIKTQYDIATDSTITESYAFKDNGATVTVQRGEHEYLLEKEGWKCDCEFAQTMKLPCRHAMVYRKACGNPFMIPYSAIDPRWFGQSRLVPDEVTELPNPFVAKVFKVKQGTLTMSQGLSEAEKFRRAQQQFVRIGGELAQLPDDRFQSAMSELDQWWYNLRQRDPTVVNAEQSGTDEAGRVDNESGKGSGAEGPDDPGEAGQDTSGGAGQLTGGGKDSSDDEPPTQVAKPEAESSTTVPTVKLSGKIRRVGRPTLNRAVVKEKARVAHKEYNQGMKLRALLRESDVCDVVATLREITPCVREVGSFLATLQVKRNDPRKQAKWVIQDDYVATRVRFRLPESSIDRALEQLNAGLSNDEKIELDSDGERSGEVHCFVVAYEKLGCFTREQLEAMKWMWNMQETCRNAMLCCTWITTKVKAVVDDAVKPHVTFIDLLECWPYDRLHGVGFDLTYTDLFCFRDSAWLNDNAMRAVTAFLATYKNNASVAMPPPRIDSSKKKQKGLLMTKFLEEVAAGLEKQAFVLVPVNFGGTHWAGIVVDRFAKKDKIYDSMHGKKNTNRLKKMAREIIVGALKDKTYTTLEITEPTQEDSDNCGVFVCHFFWSSVSDEAPSDLSPTGLLKLSWSLLHSILKMKR